MKLNFQIKDRKYECDLNAGHSIAIQMDFDGKQPNHFGVEPAKSSAIELDGFVGDTARGGSCNVDQLNLIPHCNGTHTESVGHIVDASEKVTLAKIVEGEFFPAILISVTPVAPPEKEAYRPTPVATDRMVTAEAIKSGLSHVLGDQFSELLVGLDQIALIIRTLPNDEAKQSRVYGSEHDPAFLTTTAMELIRSLDFKHLLVDLPSVDKMYDDGLLTNHHVFWNVKEGTHELTGETLRSKTITEMVFVSDKLDDGVYGLNLQVPALKTDAAPSRPILYPTTPGK